jgi:hypothetical protein
MWRVVVHAGSVYIAELIGDRRDITIIPRL